MPFTCPHAVPGSRWDPQEQCLIHANANPRRQAVGMGMVMGLRSMVLKTSAPGSLLRALLRLYQDKSRVPRSATAPPAGVLSSAAGGNEKPAGVEPSFRASIRTPWSARNAREPEEPIKVERDSAQGSPFTESRVWVASHDYGMKMVPLCRKKSDCLCFVCVGRCIFSLYPGNFSHYEQTVAPFHGYGAP